MRQGGAAPLVWPVAGAPGAARPTIERAWEPPLSAWGPGHRGVDLTAPAGRQVRAAAPGRVSFAGRVAGRGVVAVELPGPRRGRPPLRTTYEPVRALVAEGDRVEAGQVIGLLEDRAHHCPWGCLHWGLLRGERYLDPLSLLPGQMLRPGPSRLLPVFGVPMPQAGRGFAAGPLQPDAVAWSVADSPWSIPGVGSWQTAAPGRRGGAGLG